VGRRKEREKRRREAMACRSGDVLLGVTLRLEGEKMLTLQKRRAVKRVRESYTSVQQPFWEEGRQC